MSASAELKVQWGVALRRWLELRDETALAAAYALGRRALRPVVVLKLPLGAEDRARRAEEEVREGQAEVVDDNDWINHDGTRVGLNEPASTVACAVQPSAIVSPSRSIAYS